MDYFYIGTQDIDRRQCIGISFGIAIIIEAFVCIGTAYQIPMIHMNIIFLQFILNFFLQLLILTAITVFVFFICVIITGWIVSTHKSEIISQVDTNFDTSVKSGPKFCNDVV
jgi:hypothetical protein